MKYRPSDPPKERETSFLGSRLSDPLGNLARSRTLLGTGRVFRRRGDHFGPSPNLRVGVPPAHCNMGAPPAAGQRVQSEEFRLLGVILSAGVEEDPAWPLTVGHGDPLAQSAAHDLAQCRQRELQALAVLQGDLHPPVAICRVHGSRLLPGPQSANQEDHPVDPDDPRGTVRPRASYHPARSWRPAAISPLAGVPPIPLPANLARASK